MATDDEEHKCAICRTSMFNLFDDDFAEVSSLLCGHTFHECCLRDMRVVAPHQPLKCPICRTTSDDMLRAQAFIFSDGVGSHISGSGDGSGGGGNGGGRGGGGGTENPPSAGQISVVPDDRVGEAEAGGEAARVEEGADADSDVTDSWESETDPDDDAEDVGDHLAGEAFEAAIMPTPKAEARAKAKAKSAAAKAKAKAKAEPKAKPKAKAKAKAKAAAAIAAVPSESTELVEAGGPRVKRARQCENIDALASLLHNLVDPVPGELNRSSTIVAEANQGAGSSTDLPPDATMVVHANQGASSSMMPTDDVADTALYDDDAGMAVDSPPTQAQLTATVAVVKPRRPQLFFHVLRWTISYSKASCIAVRAARTHYGTGTGF